MRRNTETATVLRQRLRQVRRPRRRRRIRKQLRKLYNHEAAVRAAAGEYSKSCRGLSISAISEIKTALEPFGCSAISISARSATACLGYPSAAGIKNLN